MAIAGHVHTHWREYGRGRQVVLSQEDQLQSHKMLWYVCNIFTTILAWRRDAEDLA